MKLNLLFFLLLLSGCISVRPVTRAEYGRNTFYPETTKSMTTEYGYAEGGIRLQKDSASLDLLIGPQTFWSDVEDPNVGANLNPRFFYFFDKDTFLHLETDITLYDDNTNVFTFFAIERVW